MKDILSGREPTVRVHRNGHDGLWLCSMHFGKTRLKDTLLTNGSTKYIAVGRMRKYAKRLGVSFPKRVHSDEELYKILDGKPTKTKGRIPVERRTADGRTMVSYERGYRR